MFLLSYCEVSSPSAVVFVCLIAICCACIFTITNNTCIWWIHIWCQGHKRRKQTIMDTNASLMRQMHRELMDGKVNSNFAFTFSIHSSTAGCFFGFSSDFPRPADWLLMSRSLPKHAENTTSRLIKINSVDIVAEAKDSKNIFSVRHSGPLAARNL